MKNLVLGIRLLKGLDNITSSADKVSNTAVASAVVVVVTLLGRDFLDLIFNPRKNAENWCYMKREEKGYVKSKSLSKERTIIMKHSRMDVTTVSLYIVILTECTDHARRCGRSISRRNITDITRITYQKTTSK